ncbi:hypothetical protein PAXRUDRAFT_22095 [Paxillus rubicundulus Ve08.2h10]|uniref:Uncharacterized protein n=1 Tax=Paxillus rubicundulus Ve08.2h10 TaxID=930991 RepID=A0A0D0BL10_9AGAM|nr:hypothetical protein PAXRUDRAFT_22095 [Paxillus rubicundulus Ve08.2h10]
MPSIAESIVISSDLKHSARDQELYQEESDVEHLTIAFDGWKISFEMAYEAEISEESEIDEEIELEAGASRCHLQKSANQVESN